MKNTFTLCGYINWINPYYDNYGNCRTKIFLGQKIADKDSGQSFPITFFNKNGKTIAEDILEECKKGDIVEVSGVLCQNKYKLKDSNFEVNTTNLVGYRYARVVWDNEAKRYVRITPHPQQESKAA